MSPVLILGAGYTGRRVAARLKRRGLAVTEVGRAAMDFERDEAFARLAEEAPDRCLALLSIPVLESGCEVTPRIVEALAGRAERMVYLSTTGVYGREREVDERTPAAPESDGARLRVRAERAVLASGGMVLRPAAIYGPGRGMHVSMAEGRFRLWGDGSNYVSRIHVDDLAALCEAALLSRLGGAWPVADEEAARSRDVAGFVCGLLGCPMAASGDELHETRRADRRVDGRAVARALGVELQYKSYRTGIPASLGAEGGRAVQSEA